MFNRKEFSRKTGFYRSQDAIENFKFRVSLQRINSMLKLPKFDRSEDHEDVENPTDIAIIEWQQKVFSARERKLFADGDRCQTDLHKRYHQQCLLDVDDGDRHNTMLFTYIADDEFVPSKKCVLANPEHLSSAGSKTGCSHERVQIMHVMADLMETVETVLFTIRWYPDAGALLVYPDFNGFDDNPYFKEIDVNSRQLYRYCIENLSKPTAFDERDRMTNGSHHLNSKNSNVWPTLSSSIFAQPPRRCMFANILLEIESAHGFEYDNIHVRWCVRLPDHCRLSTLDQTSNVDGILVGSTHSSLKSRVDGVWRLGYTHELSLLCTIDYNSKDLVHIVYEVISIDSWQRERSEGIAVQPIPLVAGAVSAQIWCYRDLGRNTLWERLERIFIGGRRKTFQQEPFHQIEPSQQASGSASLRRFGNLTKSTGKLHIRTQTVVQHNNNVMFGHSSDKYGLGKRATNAHQSADDFSGVLDAYEKAKQRLAATTNRYNCS